MAGNALYWLERFGVDGLRVDAVSSMIYRDYSREKGEWVPNKWGGKENLEALDFLRYTNQIVQQNCPHALMIAEESTAFPKVTGSIENHGLGFDFKWDLGWMHDTLRYMSLDPIYRQYHHQQMTFGMFYAHSEHFVLPFHTMKWCMAKGHSSAKCPAILGKNLPIYGLTMVSCGGIRVKNCCLWEENSPKEESGITTRGWIGIY